MDSIWLGSGEVQEGDDVWRRWGRGVSGDASGAHGNAERLELFVEVLGAVVVIQVIAESKAAAGFDVGGEVVDVEGFFGCEAECVGGVAIHAGAGFHVAHFVGIDGFREMLEYRVAEADEPAVDRADVGEQDQAEAACGQGFGKAPRVRHRLKDVFVEGSHLVGGTGKGEILLHRAEEFVLAAVAGLQGIAVVFDTVFCVGSVEVLAVVEFLHRRIEVEGE